MKCLITAGNTMTLVDQVRCLTNIFSGRTGARIALCACSRGHAVTLLTSSPDVAGQLPGGDGVPADRLQVRPYRTFDDLRESMERHLVRGDFDVVVHSAAVSDYECAGVYAPAQETRFQPETGCWEGTTSGPPALVSRRAGKVKSDEPELWLRLVRTPKLVDLVRSPWGFRGILVKFKLEVGLSEAGLLEVAESSRRLSTADLMVANTLEGMEDWALLGPEDGGYQRLARADLPARLIEAVELLHAERARG